MKITITEKLLHKTVEHIQYEIDMFRFAVRMLANSPSQEITNAFLEVFAIHCRNLIYFFYTPKRLRKKPDDVLAEDYVIHKRVFKTNRTPKGDLKIVQKKTAKQVAHLTYYRTRYNKRTKPWKFIDIAYKLEKTIFAFHVSLPADKRDWFNLSNPVVKPRFKNKEDPVTGDLIQDN